MDYSNSLITLHSNSALLCRSNVAGTIKRTYGLHVKCPIVNEFRTSRPKFIKFPVSNFKEIRRYMWINWKTDEQT